MEKKLALAPSLADLPLVEQYQMIGLGALIAVGAIVIGYLVKMAVPKKHFPCTAGLLASTTVVAACAYAGVRIAGELLVGWLVVVSIVAAFLFIADLHLKDDSS